MNKKFEYIDDNPGSYFGMLVESFEDKEDKKNFRNWIEKKVGKQMSSMKPTKIGYKHGRPYYSVDFVDGTSDDYFIDFDKKEIEKCESLKEDSEYKTLAKLSNGLEVISYPYGYAVSDGYVADRFVVRDGKYIFDDGRFHLSDKDKQKILSLINKGVVKESLKESYSKSDLYSALEYMYGFNKKEANDWIKKASDKMKQSVVDGWKGNAKKSALTDSLKEDKFVSRDKMSKKDRKELDSQKRNTWGNTNPVTRVQPNKKAYDRKRDKKELNESSDGMVDELTNLCRYAEFIGDNSVADEILSKWNGLDNVYDAIDLMSSSALSSAIKSARRKLFGPLDRKRDKKELDESKELNEANYKRFKREPFDLFTTVRTKLGMRSKLETYYINGFGEVMLSLYMPKDNFFRLDFSHYTSSGYNRSRKAMSYDEIDNVSDELGLNSALKDMGAAKISKYWDSRLSESGISFLIPVRAAQKLKDEFESNEDNRESEYKTSIENVDISEYKPDKNILLDIKRYGVRGKIPPRSNIKNAERALMYLYNALLCGSYNTDKFAYIAKEMGADVDIINALIEQVEPVSGAYLEDRIDKIIYGKTNM